MKKSLIIIVVIFIAIFINTDIIAQENDNFNQKEIGVADKDTLISVPKLTEKGRKLLEELELTDRIKKLVDCAPDTMPGTMTMEKYVLLRFLSTNDLQRRLWEYNKKAKETVPFYAALGIIGIYSKELREKKIATKNIK